MYLPRSVSDPHFNLVFHSMKLIYFESKNLAVDLFVNTKDEKLVSNGIETEPLSAVKDASYNIVRFNENA